MSKTPIYKEDKELPIPPPYNHKFNNGIRHPLLHLWDSWSYMDADIMHLYCLAVSRLKPDGTPLRPMERNDFPFHIRHFTSDNVGKSWKDEGCFLKRDALSKNFNFYTIWSGSVDVLPDGRKLVAFTALENV